MSPSATQYQQRSLRTRALRSSLSSLPLFIDSHSQHGVSVELRLAGDHLLLSFVVLDYSLCDRRNRASEGDKETYTNEAEVPRKLLAKKLVQLLKTLSYVC